MQGRYSLHPRRARRRTTGLLIPPPRRCASRRSTIGPATAGPIVTRRIAGAPPFPPAPARHDGTG